MRTALLCFALFLLLALSGAHAKKSLERVDPEVDSLQLVIDVDETVLIQLVSSDKATGSVSVNTDVEEVVLQRDASKYTVKKVKAKSTPGTTKKPNTTPIPTPNTKHNNDDSSSAFAASPSFFTTCVSVLAIGCHFVFGEKLNRSTRLCVLLVAFLALCCSSVPFTSASSKSRVTVRVLLPDDIKVTITQKTGRHGIIDVEGDHSSPIRVKSLHFVTSTDTELKNVAVESCDTITINSQGSITVDEFLAPLEGSCSIFFQASKRVVASFVDGFLGSFSLYCKESSTQTSCIANAQGTAVKHVTDSGLTAAVDLATTYNATTGDTLCDGAVGYNTLTVSGTRVNVDFGYSAPCSASASVPVVGTPVVLESTSRKPATSKKPTAPSTSKKPAAPSSSSQPAASPSTSIQPAAPSSSSQPASSPSTSTQPAAPSSSSLPASSPSTSSQPAAPSSSSQPAASPSASEPAPASPSPSSLVESSCRTVNGIRWCFNPTACGESCEDVCKFFGFTITIDDATWFNAQNELSKCQDIANAFGVSTVNLDSWSYGCLEDFPGVHTDPAKLLGPIYCSTESACPALHRTATDQLGASCDVQSRKSICPCQ